eukprot:31175-Pelagococcus_subviridis.AAC.14
MIRRDQTRARAETSSSSSVFLSLAARSLALAAVDDLDLRLRRPVLAPLRLHRADDVLAARDLPEDDVPHVQMRRRRRGDEKLRPVRVRAGVCHREQKRTVVRDPERFVFKLLAVDGLPARAVRLREVPALAHEARDDAVEARPFEVQRFTLRAVAFFTRAQRAEILRRLRDVVSVQPHLDDALALAVDRDLEEYALRDRRVTGRGQVRREDVLPRLIRVLSLENDDDQVVVLALPVASVDVDRPREVAAQRGRGRARERHRQPVAVELHVDVLARRPGRQRDRELHVRGLRRRGPSRAGRGVGGRLEERARGDDAARARGSRSRGGAR